MGAVPHEIVSKGWLSMNFTSPLVNLTLLLGLILENELKLNFFFKKFNLLLNIENCGKTT